MKVESQAKQWNAARETTRDGFWVNVDLVLMQMMRYRPARYYPDYRLQRTMSRYWMRLSLCEHLQVVCSKVVVCEQYGSSWAVQ